MYNKWCCFFSLHCVIVWWRWLYKRQLEYEFCRENIERRHQRSRDSSREAARIDIMSCGKSWITFFMFRVFRFCRNHPSISYCLAPDTSCPSPFHGMAHPCSTIFLKSVQLRAHCTGKHLIRLVHFSTWLDYFFGSFVKKDGFGELVVLLHFCLMTEANREQSSRS